MYCPRIYIAVLHMDPWDCPCAMRDCNCPLPLLLAHNAYHTTGILLALFPGVMFRNVISHGNFHMYNAKRSMAQRHYCACTFLVTYLRLLFAFY